MASAPGVRHAVHLGSHLFRPAGPRVQRTQRSDDPGTGDHPARYRVTDGAVHRAPEALHGGEARLQHPEAVFDGVERGDLRWVAAGQPAVLAEVPAQVDVGVDESREERAAGEIEPLAVHRQFGHRQDHRDPAFAHHDAMVLENPAPAVQHAVRGEDQHGVMCRVRVRLRLRSAPRKQPANQRCHANEPPAGSQQRCPCHSTSSSVSHRCLPRRFGHWISDPPARAGFGPFVCLGDRATPSAIPGAPLPLSTRW